MLNAFLLLGIFEVFKTTDILGPLSQIDLTFARPEILYLLIFGLGFLSCAHPHAFLDICLLFFVVFCINTLLQLLVSENHITFELPFVSDAFSGQPRTFQPDN